MSALLSGQLYRLDPTARRPFGVFLLDYDRSAEEVFKAQGASTMWRDIDRYKTVEDGLDRFGAMLLRGACELSVGQVRRRLKQTTDQPGEAVVILAIRERDEQIGEETVLLRFMRHSPDNGNEASADTLQTFTLRQAAAKWDTDEAYEHVRQVHERHIKPLVPPAAGQVWVWKEAFERPAERALVGELLGALEARDDAAVSSKLKALLNDIARSFGALLDGKDLFSSPLPPEHGIGVTLKAMMADGFTNPLRGMSVQDRKRQGLLGYIVYTLEEASAAQAQLKKLRKDNIFHNVLVLSPTTDGLEVELWHEKRLLNGRLTRNGARYSGVDRFISMVSRFFTVSVAQVREPKELAEALAERAQRLKEVLSQRLEVLPAADAAGLRLEERTLHHLLKLFGGLIPKMTHEDFADAYAQTVTYCLLAARWAGRRDLRALEEETQRTKGRGLRADEIEFFTLTYAKGHLPRTSPFLRAFAQELFNLDEDALLLWLIQDIVGLLAHVNVEDVFSRGDGLAASDPVIHFYEDFLDKYDKALRNKLGVYYTPNEVVRFMVRAADDWARATYKLDAGLASDVRWGEYLRSKEAGKAGITALPAGCREDDFVVTILDPATGTGTFLKHTIEHIAAYKATQWAHYTNDAQRQREWAKYVREGLLKRLVGFELMMAPYVVCHLRLELLLREVSGLRFTFAQATTGGDRLQVYMTNTLSAPLSPPAEIAEADRAFYDELTQAQAFKFDRAATVVIGNPPYRRLAGGDSEGAEWVLVPQAALAGRAADKSMFDDMLDVARAHTIFSHHASLYDLYVYFWRWGMWKAFEQSDKPALITFITNGTWVNGPGFVGLRQMARELADVARVVDLGGENRGANKEPNVFNIETPVAICALARGGASRRGEPAASLYRKIDGASGQEKLVQLAELDVWRAVDGSGWAAPPPDWRESLNPPKGGAAWQDMPALIDLFPWQQPGCMWNRLWPISPARTILDTRWYKLVSSSNNDRPTLYRTAKTGRNIFTKVGHLTPLAELSSESNPQEKVKYGYRSFDTQWVFNDPRLCNLDRPLLWASLSNSQIFMCSPTTKETSSGPCMVVFAYVPDKDAFRGSEGGKDILPLYRDAAGKQANVTDGLLSLLGQELGIAAPMAEDLAAYVYALLSGLGYQERFAEELMTPGPRVPLTRDVGLWSRAVEHGRWLLWVHTYAERFVDDAAGRGTRVPAVEGLAWNAPVVRMPETTKDVRYDAASKTLRVGDGVVEGVRAEVWGFEVSGMPVVYKWLGYRTKKGAGKAASSKNPLDHIRLATWPQDWSDELIELLSVLTLTIDRQAELKALLEAICEGPLIKASELPTPTAEERAVPKVVGVEDEGDDEEEGEGN